MDSSYRSGGLLLHRGRTVLWPWHGRCHGRRAPLRGTITRKSSPGVWAPDARGHRAHPHAARAASGRHRSSDSADRVISSRLWPLRRTVSRLNRRAAVHHFQGRDPLPRGSPGPSAMATAISRPPDASFGIRPSGRIRVSGPGAVPGRQRGRSTPGHGRRTTRVHRRGLSRRAGRGGTRAGRPPRPGSRRR